VKESYVIGEGEWRPSVAEERQVGVYFTQKEGCKGTERASVLSMLFQSKRERENSGLVGHHYQGAG